MLNVTMYIYNMYIYMVRMYIYNEHTEDNVPCTVLIIAIPPIA